MARTKGMLNLSGNLEVNAQAPLDARTIVPTEADLTVASNFPYPYVGLEVYVTGTGKKFRLTNLDTTQSSSWQEIGEGGGGQTYNDFTGATASTAGAHGLVPAPSAGDEDKVLFGNGLWGALPSVDLSGLSPEAFQFSLTEKVVGQWTNGKLLYQRTFEVNATPAFNTWVNILTLSNVDKVVGIPLVIFINNNGNYLVTTGYGIEFMFDGSILKAEYNVNLNNRPINMITLLYTKTTDSPLPSDVKFAGVLSDGTVVYKKTVATGGSAPSGTTLIYRLALLNSTDVVYYTLAS
jgi:hypothetical protein